MFSMDIKLTISMVCGMTYLKWGGLMCDHDIITMMRAEIEDLQIVNEKLRDALEIADIAAHQFIVENEKLRAALKPFADVAEEVNAINLRYRDIEIWVAVGDLRAARAALEKKND